MLACAGRYHAAARGALKKADLQQIRLVYIFDRLAFFTDRSGYRIQSDRAALKAENNGAEHFMVDFVQTERVDLNAGKGRPGDLQRDDAVPLDLCEIADALQQPVGDPWRTAGTHPDLAGGFADDLNLQNVSGPAEM